MNDPSPEGGINEYKDYQLETSTNGEGNLRSNQAEPKNDLPPGNTNEQIRALQKQVEEQRNLNNQLLLRLEREVNQQNAETPEQELDKLLQQKPNGNALNEGSQISQKLPRRIRNERNEFSNVIAANQGIEERNRMGPIQEMERQRQERISASRQNRNKFKFNNPKNQQIYNEAVTRNRSNSNENRNESKSTSRKRVHKRSKEGKRRRTERKREKRAEERRQKRRERSGEGLDSNSSNEFTPVMNGDYQGENLNKIQNLLYGKSKQVVTGGKNKRKYNKRKLKTKIDKIPKKYILKL